MMSEEEVKKTGEDIVELFRSVILTEESIISLANNKTIMVFAFP